ncbi:MAG: hypothetical protein ABI995_04120, partial [Acidobacteriota bacterium]
PARAADAVTVTSESPLLKAESATTADAGKLTQQKAGSLPVLADGAGGQRNPLAIAALTPGTNAVVNGQPGNAARARLDGQNGRAGFGPAQGGFGVTGGNAFTYTVTGQNTVRIVPLQNGFLEVAATGVAQPLFRRNPVVPGTVIELNVPQQAQDLQVDFSTAEAVLPVAATRHAQLTGTLSLPNGGNPRVLLTIPARP